MLFKDEICEKYGSRMHRKSKKNFRDYVSSLAKKMGYPCKVEKNIFAKNVVMGNPEKAEFVLTAHYDTPPRLPKFFVKHMLLHCLISLPLIILGINYLLPEILLSLNAPIKVFRALTYVLPIANIGICGGLIGYVMGLLGNANKKNYNDNSSGVLAILNLMDKYKDAPQEIKDKFCFVLTDNEEKGLFGGFSYAHKHKKELKNQTIINLDCVGKGNQFNMYYAGKKVPEIVKELNEKKHSKYIFNPKRSGFMSMSDHIAFKKYNHVCFLSVDEHNNKSLYSQIHSVNDTSLDEENIDFLVDVIDNTLISDTKAKEKEKIKQKKLLKMFNPEFYEENSYSHKDNKEKEPNL